MQGRRIIVLAIGALAALAPLVTAGHDWVNGSYYNYADSSASPSTLAPGQGFTHSVAYRQVYTGYSTLRAYQESSAKWTSGPYHNGAGTVRSLGIGTSAPTTPGSYDLTTYVVAAYSAYPTPSYYNAYTHTTITVVGNPSAPCIGEDHAGAGWTTHNSPHWTWGCSSAAYGSISQWQVQPSWGGAFTTGATDYHPTLGTGAHWLRVRAMNNVGQWSAWTGERWVYVDVTAPTSSLSRGAPSVASGGATWVTSATPFAVTGGDVGCGLAALDASVDGGAFFNGGAGFTLQGADGAHTIAHRARDCAGNVEATRSATFSLDNTAPAVAIATPASGVLYAGGTSTPLPPEAPVQEGAAVVVGDVTIAMSATDAGVGLASATLSIDGQAVRTFTSAPFEHLWRAGDLAMGVHTIEWRGVDRLGNAAVVARDVFTVPTTPAGLAATAEALTSGELPDLPDAPDVPDVPDVPGLPDVPDVPDVPGLPDVGPLPPTVRPVFSVVADPGTKTVTYRVGVEVNGQFLGAAGRLPP